MKRALKASGRRYQRGSIAVEAAIVLLILIIVIVPLVKVALYFRQY